VFVKVCGITSEEDALMSVAMGADALGFVFAPSPRQVAVDRVRDIVRRLPAEILTIGVFRDEAAQRVVELAHAAGLRGVQLHGHEQPAEAAWIRKRVPFVVQGFSANDPALVRARDYGVDAILLDGAQPGSGQVFDWALAELAPVGLRLIVAGGLTPENVGEAVARIRPWGLDVSSGVEAAPGRKDVRKVRAFVNAAKTAEAPGYTGDPELMPYDWEEDEIRS
jgi:phosphoribosylanthranilate isomerase